MLHGFGGGPGDGIGRDEAVHVDAETLNRAVRDLTWTYRRFPKRQVVRLDGHRRIVFPGDPEGEGAPRWVRAKHRRGRIHEPALLAALCALEPVLPARCDVLDIGALYGYVSLMTASIFPEARIHAFEANPKSFEAMAAVVDANPQLGRDRFRLLQLAVSDQVSGKVTVGLIGLTLVEGGQGTDLDFTSVDAYCSDHDCRPALIKIDVEGFQAKVVPGAMQTLEASRPVLLLEFDNPDKLEPFHTTNRAIVAPIMDLGYRLFWTDEHRIAGDFRQLQLSDLGPTCEVNSLAVLVPDEVG